MPGESVVEGRCAAGILSHGQIVEDVFACVRLLPVYVKLFYLVSDYAAAEEDACARQCSWY